MKNWNASSAAELYNKFRSGVRTAKNLLFIGNNFDPEKLSDILSLRWNLVITSITDNEKFLSVINKLQDGTRNIRNISASQALSSKRSLMSKGNIVDSANLYVVSLMDQNDMRDHKNIEPGPDQREIANEFMQEFVQDMIKDLGCLFCVGYTADDSLMSVNNLITQLRPIKKSRGDECVFLFEAEDKMNSVVKKVEENGIFDCAVLFEESLESLWEPYISYEQYDDDDSSYDSTDLQIYIDGKYEYVPVKETIGVKSFAKLLDYSAMTPAAVQKHRASERFEAFLRNDSVEPKWFGYREGYDLKRDYQNRLYDIVTDYLENPEKEKPIILHGQSGSGKSIALGRLAYDVFHDRKFPVIYITNPDFVYIDEEEEENSTSVRKNAPAGFIALKELIYYLRDKYANRSALLIWDRSGLDREREDYFLLHKYLRNFGLNIVLVGTSYTVSNGNDANPSRTNQTNPFRLIPVTININSNELKNWTAMLKNKVKLGDEMLSDIENALKKESDNDIGSFLTMLYYSFRCIRGKLSVGITEEFKSYFREIENKNKGDKQILSNGVKIGENLAAWLKKYSDDNNEVKEKINDFAIFISMFTYYNKEISIDFIYNIFKGDYQTLQNVLAVPMFICNDYSNRSTYKLRTRLEAKMVLRSYGIDISSNSDEKMAEGITKYLCKLLYYIKHERFNSTTELEAIDLAVKVIRIIGPNNPGISNEKWRMDVFFKYAPCMIKALYNASLYASDPRLVLQDLVLTREYIVHSRTGKKDGPKEFEPISFREFSSLMSSATGEEYIDDDDEWIGNEDAGDDNYYLPDLNRAIERACDYLEVCEKDRYDVQNVILLQIRVDIVNSFLLLKENDKAKNLCDEIQKKNENAMFKNSYCVHAWLRTHYQCLTETMSNEDFSNTAGNMMDFLTAAMNQNPDLSSERHVVNVCMDFFKEYKKRVSSQLETMEAFLNWMQVRKPTSAIVRCWVYNRCIQEELITASDSGLQWSSVKKDSGKYVTLQKIYGEFERYEKDHADIDRYYMYLKLQIFWLLKNGQPLNLKDEKQHTYMSGQAWEEIRDMCAFIRSLGDPKDTFSANCQYIEALAMCHLLDFKGAQEMLKNLKGQLDYRWYLTKHIVCDEEGSPLLFGGTNIKFGENNLSGKLDVYLSNDTSINLKNVWFNRNQLAESSPVRITTTSTLDNIELGVGIMGLTALPYKGKGGGDPKPKHASGNSKRR